MRKTTVYLPDDLDRALKAKAKRMGAPAAELLREAVRASLEGEDGVRWPGSIGAGAAGRFAAADDEAVLEREWGSSAGRAR
jgi:predicted transcriptional regulator